MRHVENESELVAAAAGGDGAAFVALYDFHARTVFSFCRRVLGSADAAADITQDAFLDVVPRLPRMVREGEPFGIAVLAAARAACYDLLERRPAGEQSADRLPAAHARLRPRQRAALALRELAGLQYAEIAAVMDMDQAAVPGLLARARLRLRDELRGSALASTALASASCEEALPLLAAADDGELPDGAEADWLATHLDDCESCALTRRAMAEGVAAYRAWEPEAPPPWLRRAALAEAAEQSGADWSAALAAVPPVVAPEQLAIGGPMPVREPERPRRTAGAAAGAGAGAGVVAGIAATTGAAAAAAPPRSRPDRHAARRRRRAATVLSSVGLGLLACVGVALAAAGGIAFDLGGGKQAALQVPSHTRTVEIATGPQAALAPAHEAVPRHARSRPLHRRARRHAPSSRTAVLASYAPPRIRLSGAPAYRPSSVQRLQPQVERAPEPVRRPPVRPHHHVTAHHPQAPAPTPPPTPAPAPAPQPVAASTTPPPSGTGAGGATPAAPTHHGHGQGHGNGNGNGHGNGNGQGDGNSQGDGNGQGDGNSQGTPQPAAAGSSNGCAPAGQSCGPPPRCRPWANCHNDHGQGKGQVELGAITLPAVLAMGLVALAWPPRRRRRRARR